MHGFRVGTSQTDSNTARGNYFALSGLLLPGAGRAANRPRPRHRCDRDPYLRTAHEHPILYPRYAQPVTRGFCYPHCFADRDDHLDPQPDVYPVYAAHAHRHTQSNGNPYPNEYSYRDAGPHPHADSYPASTHTHAYTDDSSANRDGYGY